MPAPQTMRERAAKLSILRFPSNQVHTVWSVDCCWILGSFKVSFPHFLFLSPQCVTIRLVFVHFRNFSVDDLGLWLPQPEMSVQELNTDLALFLLTYVGDQFCWMVQVEKEGKAGDLAVEGGDSTTGTIAWKRAVDGFRELCDVCQTTLFNIHWTCGECGFVVCIDCYKARKAVLSPSNGKENGDDEEEEVLVLFLVVVIF